MPVATEKLRHPPVVEAVCEFRFARGVSYSLVPGAIAERLRHQFPKHEVLPAASFMAAIPDEVPIPSVPHHRFRSDSPNALIQTGPRLLTINVLPVYPGFEVFRQMILNVLEHYRIVANPGSPTRVGLRYINFIRSAQERDALSSYLKCSFGYPSELPQPPRETAARLLLGYGESGTLGLSVAYPSRIGEGEQGTLLDLDFFWNGPSEFPLDEFQAWLGEAHKIIYAAFISTVREEIMTKFRGVRE